MTLPPLPGTLDYAIWAYTREMERAEAERDVSRAPWNWEQVAALRDRQLEPSLHSYYCECGDILRPQTEGWYCFDCAKIVQTWCHSADLDRWWLQRHA